jgi:hypothetical protein
LIFRGAVYEDDSEITKSEAQALFIPNFLSKELEVAFDKHLKSLIDHEYIYGLVSVKNQYAATFPDDLSKGQACIISGECGIGKTWFATRCIPSRFRDASIICYEVSDDDMQPQPQWNNMIMVTVEATQIIYQDCMKALRDK